LWDVDGSGLQKIQDTGLATAILRKTNEMNKAIGIKAVSLTVILAVAPTVLGKLQ
jgi:hypothetical protein